MKKIKLWVIIAIFSCGFYVAYGIIFEPVYGNTFVYWNVQGQHKGDPLLLPLNSALEMYICAGAPFDVCNFEIKTYIVFMDVAMPIPHAERGRDWLCVENGLPVQQGKDLMCRFHLQIPKQFVAGFTGELRVELWDPNVNLIAAGKTKIKVVDNL